MVKVGCGSIVMAVIVCFGLSTGIYADDYGAWAYSRNCTLNTAATGANIDSNVYNFPVLIRLNTSNFNFNQLSDQSGGTDLRFAKSDGTHLAYQIERCDGGVPDSAEIWVHLDTVRGNNSTQYLKMYWGKSGAGDSSRPRQVFDTAKGWRGVWHLNGTANLIDQTARQLVDTNHSTSSDAGNIGSSIAMGQGNWIGVPPSLMAGMDSNITVSFWNKGNTTGLPKSDDRIDIIMSSGAQWYNGFGWRIMQDTSINCYWGDGNGANNVNYKLTTTSQWKGQWNHWAFRRSPGTWWLYINGAQVATGTTNRAMNGNAVNRVELGSQDCGGDYSYRGKLDEMRFSRTTRSSQWLKLEYENQKSNQTLIRLGIATPVAVDTFETWAYSQTIKLNTAATGANIDSNVYNFPVLIRLNTSNFNFNQLSDQSGGTDLRFAKSDGTHLAYQIERCDGVSDSAEVWVHLDTVRGNNSTQYLKMYWGKSGAGDSSRPRQVFDTAKGWRGVWHLNGTNNLTDQTARQLVDTNHSTSSDAGNIGSSIAMGQGNWIGVPPSLMAGMDSNITVSFWNKGNTTGLPKSDDRIDIIMSSGAQWYNGFGWRIMQDTSINCYWGDGNGANNVNYKLTTTSQWKGQWNHWAFRRSPGTWWLYINGAQVATGTTNRAMNGNAVNRVELGSQDCGGDYSYRGKLDEMRFSRTTRPSQWLKLEYENQKSNQTLISFVPENYSQWRYSSRIYFNTTTFGANVANNVDNFPYLVRLNDNNFHFYNATWDGSDIRFSDPNGTQLNFDIEYWDASTRNAAIWVKVPRVSGNSVDDYINIHYGRYSTINRSNPTGVWDSSCVGTWYLGEYPLGDSSGVILDVSGHGHNGTPSSGMNFSHLVNGQVGKAIRFDGSSNYINTGAFDVYATAGSNNGLAMEAWIKADAFDDAGGDSRILAKSLPGTEDSKNYWMLGTIKDGSNIRLKFALKAGGSTSTLTATAGTLTTGTWIHIAATYDGSYMKLYKDGVLVGALAKTGTIGTNDTVPVWIGSNPYGNNKPFKGIIDGAKVYNASRSADWIKLAYENQRTDKNMQLTNTSSIYPVIDGTIASKPNDFINTTCPMTVKYGTNAFNDSIKYLLMRYDLREATRLKANGWSLTNSALNLTIHSATSPTIDDTVYFGLYGTDRVLPVERLNGNSAWIEDLSTNHNGCPIKMNSTAYFKGIGGTPQSDGGWSWLLFDMENEKLRLGLVSTDTLKGYCGKQDSSGTLDTYIKTSNAATAPSANGWQNDTCGVTTRKHTANSSGSAFSFSTSGVKWVWLGMHSSSSGTDRHGVWGDMKLYAKVNTSPQMQVFQIKDNGDLDTSKMTFIKKSDTLWSHSKVENDDSTDISSTPFEGIGTEDLVFGMWNRYKEKYRSRSPLLTGNLPVRVRDFDTARVYFGLQTGGKLWPVTTHNGHYPFIEDVNAGDSDTIIISGIQHTDGIGGTPDSSRYAYLVYNLATEKQRYGFGDIISITGIAGHQDSSASVDVYVKSCTTSTQPTETDWETNANQVVERVHKTGSQNNIAINLTTDGSGGEVNNIKWIWIAAKISSGSGATNHAVWADFRLNCKNYYNPVVNLQSSALNQAVAAAVQNASDTSANYLTFLVVLNDSGSASFYQSEETDFNVRPRLDLTFSDSRQLFSWEGRSSSAQFPSGKSLTLVGNPQPSLGDGRFDRVLRYHNSSQKAKIKDSTLINYAEGMLSFWYQKTLQSGSNSGAMFFRRDDSNPRLFQLGKNGSDNAIRFSYGDTTHLDSTGSNVSIWSYITASFDSLYGGDTLWRYDTTVNPFDGNQHYIELTWDYVLNQYMLRIDGNSLRQERSTTGVSNPNGWSTDTLVFGEGINGYVENVRVYSRKNASSGIAVKQIAIGGDTTGYLPPIKSSFNDTVDCIILSPDDELFRQVLEDYALRNMSMGIRSEVITLSKINTFYTGSDQQERIRNFLKRASVVWHTKWLIIGASNNYIPDRKVIFESMGGHGVNTDRYYAALEGDWNSDGDEYFGETEDNVDPTAELIVGRLPANNVPELQSMIAKSSMALGLPPYGYQAASNNDTILISGIRMFNDIGTVSDGTYYGTILKNILASGAYTKNIPLKTYFPSDDFVRDTSDTNRGNLFKIFFGKMSPMPGMWIHFGHGNSQAMSVDLIGKTNGYSSDKSLLLGVPHLYDSLMFNKFTHMSHVRVVGCETNSQDQNSIGRQFLAKPYGGALSYLGASEYSYPVVESQILQEEFRNMADSSLFSWGEICSKAVELCIQNNLNWDIGKWVMFTRNYMGDPLLPVRYSKLQAADTLRITSSGTIEDGKNTIIITVKDKNQDPVEGAMVGILKDTTTNQILADTLPMLFGKGITNKKGEATIEVYADNPSRVVITASHSDFLPGRIKTGTNSDTSSNRRPVITFKCWVKTTGSTTWHKDGFVGAGDSLKFILDFYCYKIGVDTPSVILQDTSGKKMFFRQGEETFSNTNLGGSTCYEYIYTLKLDSCRTGATALLIPIAYAYIDSTTSIWKNDTVASEIIAIVPKVMPIIQYLTRQDGDSAIIEPRSGDTINLQVMLNNKYPASAKNVRLKLIDVNTSFVHVISSGTPVDSTGYDIGANTAAFDKYIKYNIVNNYADSVNGILPAKMVITGSNLTTDTIPIDLNPIAGISLTAEKTSCDYRANLRLKWNNVKFSQTDRRSDFMGYVVTRTIENDPDSATDLLTNYPITTNFFETPMPETTGVRFIYTVIAVDSSYNYSGCGSTLISSPPRLKPAFPIFIGKDMRSPQLEDYNKDGLVEIYSATVADNGSYPIGFSANGQEAIVSGGNDGLLSQKAAGQVMFADLDNDGLDELIQVAADSLFITNFKNSAKNKAKSLFESGRSNNFWWLRKLMAADVNNDSCLEIIGYGMDNRGATADRTTLYIWDSSGATIARHNFADGNYAPALAAGYFDNSDTAFVIAAARSQEESDKYFLHYFRNPSAGSFTQDSSLFVCNLFTRTAGDESSRQKVTGGIVVGNLDTNTSDLEIVLYTGPFDRKVTGVGDTLRIFRINKSNRALSAICKYPVSFSSWTLFGSTAALADLDGDGITDIAFAADDTIYLLKLSADTIAPIRKIPFGSVAANRIGGDGYPSQALVADIDNDDSLEIITSHYGDGAIWAFNLNGTVCDRFPLKTKGRAVLGSGPVCEITDLEGDGILDLVAMDQGGYIYAWAMDSGSIYKQPWPSAYQNSWNTSFSGYRPASQIAHVYESWDTVKTKPYKWMETIANNSLHEQNDGKFVRQSGTLRLEPGTDRNFHLVGPGLAGLKNYTVSGKFKFANSNNKFGINFYSQWPVKAEKYSLMRWSDGKMRLYYYPDSVDTAKELLQETTDTIAGTINTWYNFEVQVQDTADSVKIKVYVWIFNRSPSPIISYTSQKSLRSGTVGFVTEPSGGYSYFSSIQVKSNSVPDRANLYYQSVFADSIVDIKPYYSKDIIAEYDIKTFDTNIDTTGLVVEKRGNNNPSLVMRHKNNTLSHAKYKFSPNTNLLWKDYEIRGKIIKPASASYDSIRLGITIYKKDDLNYYYLMTGKVGVGNIKNKFILYRCYDSLGARTKALDTIKTGVAFEGAVDSLCFAFRVSNDTGFAGTTITPDSTIRVQAKIWEPQSTEPIWAITYLDKSKYRIKGGYSELIAEYAGNSGFVKGVLDTAGIIYRELKIVKTK